LKKGFLAFGLRSLFFKNQKPKTKSQFKKQTAQGKFGEIPTLPTQL